MEGDRIGAGGNDWHVSISFLEPPKQDIQVQSFADDGNEEDELSIPKETGDSDDPITNVHAKMDALHLDCLNMQQSLTSFTAYFKGEFSRMQQALSLISSEDHARYLEGQLSDLEMNIELEATSFLKKNWELMMVVEAKEKEAMISLQAKLVVLRDKVDELTVERQKIRLAMKKQDEVIASLTEKLRIAREKWINILEMGKKFGATMTKKEGEIMPLDKDLLLAKENQVFRNNMLEEELKVLNNDVSNLERTKKHLSGLIADAIITSIGTVAATITIFYLRQ